MVDGSLLYQHGLAVGSKVEMELGAQKLLESRDQMSHESCNSNLQEQTEEKVLMFYDRGSRAVILRLIRQLTFKRSAENSEGASSIHLAKPRGL